jgi:hypothetical protein
VEKATMASLDIANYVDQIQSFKAADQARENLVSVRRLHLVPMFLDFMLTRIRN